MERPVRKFPRLRAFDYSTPGYYFITICTLNKRKLLGEIVGRGIPDAPLNPPHFDDSPTDWNSLDIVPPVCPGGHTLQDASAFIRLSEYGKIVDDQLNSMLHFYNHILLEKYVVMPNHIHLLIHITGHWEPEENSRANAHISRFVGTFKRFCNKKIGHNIWQTSFHDHVIRGEADYQKIWMYIETNPIRWHLDCFYEES